MKKETLSEAMGEVSARYISEAVEYVPCRVSVFKRPIGKMMIAAAVCLFILGGFGIYPFLKGGTVSAYAYGTDKEIGRADTILSTGTITDDGEMRGQPLRFYINGMDIKTIRFSCKNQWIDFKDWTEQRDEFGIGKNFTVPYGPDESQYYYLVITWEPKNTIRKLTDNRDIGIKDLPPELKEDIIVLEITFENGKKVTKAVNIELKDDGRFTASFNNYKITEEDGFVKLPDSKPVARDILYAEGDSADSKNNEKTKNSYRDVLSAEEIEAAKDSARKYYENTVWSVKTIKVTSDDNSQYKNDGIEAEYKAGNIIIFDVTAIRDNKTENRIISVARKNNGEWVVINEGF